MKKRRLLSKKRKLVIGWGLLNCDSIAEHVVALSLLGQLILEFNYLFLLDVYRDPDRNFNLVYFRGITLLQRKSRKLRRRYLETYCPPTTMCWDIAEKIFSLVKFPQALVRLVTNFVLFNRLLHHERDYMVNNSTDKIITIIKNRSDSTGWRDLFNYSFIKHYKWVIWRVVNRKRSARPKFGRRNAFEMVIR